MRIIVLSLQIHLDIWPMRAWDLKVMVSINKLSYFNSAQGGVVVEAIRFKADGCRFNSRYGR